jgi:hypothetical protein
MGDMPIQRVREEAKAAVEEIAARTKLPEYEVASRILLFAQGQPQDIQDLMLGFYGQHAPDVARIILRKMGRGK